MLLICLQTIFCTQLQKSAKIDCRIDAKVEFVSNGCQAMIDDEYQPAQFIMFVDQRMLLPTTTDTLLLKLKTPQSFPGRGIGVNIISVTDSKGRNLRFAYDYSSLQVNTAFNSDITIRYQVELPNLAKNCISIENSYFSEIYQQSMSSWFFEADEMSISKVRLKVPPRTFKIKSISKENPNSNTIAVLDRTFYKRNVLRIGRKKVVFYSQKFQDESLIVDTLLKCDNISNAISYDCRRDKKQVDSVLCLVKVAIRQSLKLFGDNNEKNLNIVERLWQERGVRFGNAVSNNLILIDKGLSNSSVLIHEILHTYDDIDYQVASADTCRILFSESMIEYLSWYIAEKSGVKLDNICQGNFDSHKSIFKVERVDVRTKNIVYYETPSKIYSFAKSVGEERFIQAYSEFHQNGVINLLEFIECLRRFNIPKDAICKFIGSL